VNTRGNRREEVKWHSLEMEVLFSSTVESRSWERLEKLFICLREGL
jgi:hypothetical protein